MTYYQIIQQILVPSLIETLYMISIAGLISIFIGFIFGVTLSVTRKNAIYQNFKIFNIINIIVNILRSFPFIILTVSIIPFTRFIIGSSIGVNAAIVPLSIGYSVVFSRLVETTLNEVNKDLIEMALSFGASKPQIIISVLLKESVPALFSNITTLIVSLVSGTAMAGAVGAGGLGAVALMYGYQSFNDKVLYSTVVVLIVVVQTIQLISNLILRKLYK